MLFGQQKDEEMNQPLHPIINPKKKKKNIPLVKLNPGQDEGAVYRCG